MRILILEDNKFDSDLTSRHLNKNIANCEIDLARTIAEAKKLISIPYDIALLDVKLPDGWGTDFLIELRKVNQKTPIIMLSGSGDEEFVVKALKFGADDYLIKKDSNFKNLSEIILNTIKEKSNKWVRSEENIRVLYIEHHKSDLDLTLRHFKKTAPQFSFTSTPFADAAINLLKQSIKNSDPYQIILSDYKLPGLNAIEATKIIRQDLKIDIPIVIVTGQGNEDIAIEALKLGADEYLVKRENYLNRLPFLLTSSYQKWGLERKKRELIESESKYRLLFEQNPQPMWIYDVKTLAFLEVNEAAILHYGYSKEEFLSMNLTDIRPKDDIQDLIDNVKNTDHDLNYAGEWRHCLKNGEIIIVEITSHAIHFNEKESRHVLINDITHRKATERDLKESEEQFRSIFEDHSAIKLIINPEDGKINSANKAAADYYGWSIDELKNMKIFDLTILPQQLTKDKMQEVLSKKNNRFESKHKHENGSISDVAIFSSTVHIKGKHFLHSIIYDISKRKKVEKQLELLSASVNQSPVSILLTNIQGSIEYVNPKFQEITGYSLGEIIGQNPRILNSSTQNNIFFKEMWDTIKSGDKWQGEICNKKKNGQLFWENMIISSIRDEDNQITHFVAVKEDITETKKMIDELIIAKEKAEQSDKLKSAFLESMSHEIRTPLNSIVGFSSLIAESTEDPYYVSLGEIVQKQNDLLLTVINDIIDFAQLESGSLFIKKETIEVQQLLKYLYNLHLEKCPPHIELIAQSVDDNITIYSDQHRIAQVFSNLISNATKFTSSGNITFGYEIFDKSNILFFVKDTGIGIAKEQQDFIFERFSKLDNYLQGIGLGLSIAKNIVNLLGGKLWLESELGKGACFYFTIPKKDKG